MGGLILFLLILICLAIPQEVVEKYAATSIDSLMGEQAPKEGDRCDDTGD